MLQHALRSEGVNCHEIARALRMRRAQQLLATPQMRLAEVALRAGYTDPSNFHRALLSPTGMTPGRFRDLSRTHARSHAEHHWGEIGFSNGGCRSPASAIVLAIGAPSV